MTSTHSIGNAATHRRDKNDAAAIAEMRHLSTSSLGGVKNAIAINVNDLLEFLCVIF